LQEREIFFRAQKGTNKGCSGPLFLRAAPPNRPLSQELWLADRSLKISQRVSISGNIWIN